MQPNKEEHDESKNGAGDVHWRNDIDAEAGVELPLTIIQRPRPVLLYYVKLDACTDKMGKAPLAYIYEMYLHRYLEESASSFLEVGYIPMMEEINGFFSIIICCEVYSNAELDFFGEGGIFNLSTVFYDRNGP